MESLLAYIASRADTERKRVLWMQERLGEAPKRSECVTVAAQEAMALKWEGWRDGLKARLDRETL